MSGERGKMDNQQPEAMSVEEVLGTYTVWDGRDVNTDNFKRTVKAIESLIAEREKAAYERGRNEGEEFFRNLNAAEGKVYASMNKRERP